MPHRQLTENTEQDQDTLDEKLPDQINFTQLVETILETAKRRRGSSTTLKNFKLYDKIEELEEQ